MQYQHAPSREHDNATEPNRSYLNISTAISRDESVSGAAGDPASIWRPSIVGMLARSLGGCALAHWYMIPGRDVWREYLRDFLRVSLKSPWRRRAESFEARFQPLGTKDFLACDFAWRDLATRFSPCSYLDVGSPWVLPLMIVRRVSVGQATVLSQRSIGSDDLKTVTNSKVEIFTTKPNELRSVRRERGPFDVVTSINWLARVAEDVEVLRLLWSAVKPGGLLFLSLPCAGSPIERQRSSRSKLKSSEESHSPFGDRVYDQGLLDKRIFEVVGPPKQQHIYGERTASHYSEQCSRGPETFSPNDYRESLAVGRDWSRFGRIGDLPGEGLVAMKFVKAAGA